MQIELKEQLNSLEVKGFARETLEFIDECATTYHVVKGLSDILDENGFVRLNPYVSWSLKEGGRYYVKKTNTTVVAFTIPNKLNLEKGFKIFGCHTDSPSIRIKPNPEMITNNMLRLNTEVYGGPNLSTWFDRSLGIAGRVVLKTDDVFRPKTEIIKIEDKAVVIPSLCIHQNRDVNNGYKIDKQNDILPIIALVNSNFEKDNYLLKLIAKQMKIEVSDILDFDLALYPLEKGILVGMNDEMMQSTKMDNLLSVYAGIIALAESGNDSGKINVYAAFDNEEIGSSTKQGADSEYLSRILERICYSLSLNRQNFLEMLANSFMLSCDTGHVAHPSFPNKKDPTNQCEMNKGVSLKLSVNQRYTSDGFSMAVIKQIAKNAGLNLQYFVNRSNEIGGSTIGPLSSTHLDIDSVDIGIPILSMHSIKELCGIYDLFDLKNLTKEFFETK
ncbi:M18 family aminopeptidase [Oceanivirga miroungae]|uniref:M18 family aminopeptidase n=1 Tax=Oceanivirga miroungae TaxID=1130046 RepID=A0A6I8M722_9FUSO|nr:M18 family aminopeptidase [Oceanivirga miroungae]VWL85674.1 aminopeptidase 2 [Oceanivirga miroungae]